MNNRVNNKPNIHGRAVRIAATQPPSIGFIMQSGLQPRGLSWPFTNAWAWKMIGVLLSTPRIPISDTPRMRNGSSCGSTALLSVLCPLESPPLSIELAIKSWKPLQTSLAQDPTYQNRCYHGGLGFVRASISFQQKYSPKSFCS